jgi:hypothetical protein
MVLSTVHEYVAEGRLSFHPVENHTSYFAQQEEAAPYIRSFVEARAPRYLRHFEALLAANRAAGGWCAAPPSAALDCRARRPAPDRARFVGAGLTVVDLHAWVMLSATIQQWPADDMLGPFPRLRALKAQVCPRGDRPLAGGFRVAAVGTAAA